MLPKALLPPSTPSMASLLDSHGHLNQLFLSHQEALLMLDTELALRRLKQFYTEMKSHIRAEEEILLPVYERAGRIKGGPPEFFIGEHAKMMAFVESFITRLEQLDPNTVGLRRELIELFDRHAAFKSLLEHHDQRERNIFYPILDQVTSEPERGDIIKRFRETASAA